jgi:hypothetical protein
MMFVNEVNEKRVHDIFNTTFQCVVIKLQYVHGIWVCGLRYSVVFNIMCCG